MELALTWCSGWHHTVENLEDTLSINHNWLNAHNVAWGVSLLRRERAQAAAAIEDCRRVTLSYNVMHVKTTVAAEVGSAY